MERLETVGAVHTHTHTHTHTSNLITKIINIERKAMYFSDA